jgi:hypothetical protein
VSASSVPRILLSEKKNPAELERSTGSRREVNGRHSGGDGGPLRVCDCYCWRLMPGVNQEISYAANEDHRRNSPKQKYWHFTSPHLPTAFKRVQLPLVPTCGPPLVWSAALGVGGTPLTSRNFQAFADLKISDDAGLTTIMERVLVRRDQFNISPQGIVHKPTDAAFIPYPGAPYAGITRMGQLCNQHPTGMTFSSDDVQRIMQELWVEYVQANPGLFHS